MIIYCQNKIAFSNYEIKDTYEAGIILKGFEVKAIRNGKANLKGSYVSLKNNNITLVGAHISPFQSKNTPDSYFPSRERILLLNEREKRKLIGFINPSKELKKNKKDSAGYSVIPLKLYDKSGLIKIEIGLGRGLKQYDQREEIKRKESVKKMNQALKY